MVVAVIPIRRGSKGIEGKNLKEIAGKPLYKWVLDSANDAECVSKAYVSSDMTLNTDIIINRPAHLCTDEASTDEALMHFAYSVEFDDLIILQATNPQTTAKDIDEAYKVFKEGEYDCLLSVVEAPKRFYWFNCGQGFMPVNYQPAKRPRKQDGLQPVYVENGAIYIVKRKVLVNYQTRLAGNTGIYVMKPETITEIDTMEDFKKVEEILRCR